MTLIMLSLSLLAQPAAGGQMNLQMRWEPPTILGVVQNLLGDTGFGIGVRQNQTIWRVSLGVQRYGFSSDFQGDSASDTTYIITPTVQLQYYVAPPTADALVGFVSARVGKAFTSTDSSDASDNLLSPWMGAAGGGLEYFFNDEVSLGMELGLRLLYTSAETGTGVFAERQSISALSLTYGAVTLNFHR